MLALTKTMPNDTLDLDGMGLTDLKAQAQTLLEEVQNIEAQLSDRNRMIGGRRLSGIEYHDWRVKAVHAKNAKMREYRRLKEQINALAHAPSLRKATGLAGSDADGMLGELVILVGRICKDHRLMLMPDEQTVMDAARAYLARGGGRC